MSAQPLFGTPHSLRIIGSFHLSHETKAPSEGFSGGEKPRLELPLGKNHGHPPVRPRRLGTVKERGCQLSRAIIIGMTWLPRWSRPPPTRSPSTPPSTGGTSSTPTASGSPGGCDHPIHQPVPRARRDPAHPRPRPDHVGHPAHPRRHRLTFRSRRRRKHPAPRRWLARPPTHPPASGHMAYGRAARRRANQRHALLWQERPG
jgi:hypothetical protein